MESRRVLILSRPGLLAQGMRCLLESDPRIEIVGITANVRQAMEIIRARQPAVLLVDADEFRFSLRRDRSTIPLDCISTLIALSQKDNRIQVCRIEAKSLAAPEELIEALSL